MTLPTCMPEMKWQWEKFYTGIIAGEKINLATKLPHYLIKSIDGVEKMFQEELRRLQTDYIDYYLMHMLTDIPTWEKLKKLGMEEWIREKKASGRFGRSDFPITVIPRCSVS